MGDNQDVRYGHYMNPLLKEACEWEESSYNRFKVTMDVRGIEPDYLFVHDMVILARFNKNMLGILLESVHRGTIIEFFKDWRVFEAMVRDIGSVPNVDKIFNAVCGKRPDIAVQHFLRHGLFPIGKPLAWMVRFEDRVMSIDRELISKNSSLNKLHESLQYMFRQNRMRTIMTA